MDELRAVSKDERTLGLVAHALTFIEGGIIGPLVLYLVKRNESEFVAFHALQSLYFGLLMVAVVLVTCGFGAIIVVPLYFIYEIVACLRASEGVWYKLPFAGDWAWRLHNPGNQP